MQEAPRQQPRPGCETRKQSFRKLRAEEKLAHQDEERKCHEIGRRQDVERILRQQPIHRRRHEEIAKAERRRQKRDADPSADGEESEQKSEEASHNCSHVKILHVAAPGKVAAWDLSFDGGGRAEIRAIDGLAGEARQRPRDHLCRQNEGAERQHGLRNPQRRQAVL